jgi:hypothetical protein
MDRKLSRDVGSSSLIFDGGVSAAELSVAGAGEDEIAAAAANARSSPLAMDVVMLGCTVTSRPFSSLLLAEPLMEFERRFSGCPPAAGRGSGSLSLNRLRAHDIFFDLRGNSECAS